MFTGIFIKNNPETILSGLEKLTNTCRENSLDVKIKAAAEYFFDNYFFELIEKRELLTFGKTHVLFELPMNSPANMVNEVIVKMIEAGYKPVLAHPERYTYFHDRLMREYHKLKSAGVLFQLNLMSLTGHYSLAIKKAAQDLIDHKLIDFAGSDLHREKHLNVLKAAQHNPYYHKLLSSGRLMNNVLFPSDE
jgi:tyrosine-protein phosphatase YwqE